jgi:integrase
VPVFPDTAGGWCDRNNVSRDLRMVRAGTDFEWFASHAARRTVATLLDDEGVTARSMADHLRHTRVSMTQDVSMGRRLPRADGRWKPRQPARRRCVEHVALHVARSPDKPQASDPVWVAGLR